MSQSEDLAFNVYFWGKHKATHNSPDTAKFIKQVWEGAKESYHRVIGFEEGHHLASTLGASGDDRPTVPHKANSGLWVEEQLWPWSHGLNRTMSGGVIKGRDLTKSCFSDHCLCLYLSLSLTLSLFSFLCPFLFIFGTGD